MLERLRQLWRSRFVRSASVLMGATAIGQLIAVLSAPLLTRIYTPEDFGVLGVYTTMLSSLGVVASLRYELAVPLPFSRLSAASLLVLCLLIVLTVTVCSAAIISVIGLPLLERLQASELWPYRWLLPLGVLSVGTYQALNFWSVRTRSFGIISRTRIVQALLSAVVKIGMGLTVAGSLGLIVGQIVSSAGGISTLARDAWKGNHAAFRSVSMARMRVLMRRYRNFAFLSAPAALVNVAWQQAPTIVMALYYGPTVTGLYLLCMRTIGLPINVIGDAVTQVFIGEIARLIKREPGRVYRLFVRCLLALAAAAVLPLTLVAIGGPTLFAWLFGPQWAAAGEYMRVLLVMFVARMAVAPLSQVLSVLERQELTLLLNLLRFGFTTGALILAGHIGATPLEAMWWLSLSMVASYVLSALLMLRALRVRVSAHDLNHGSQTH